MSTLSPPHIGSSRYRCSRAVANGSGQGVSARSVCRHSRHYAGCYLNTTNVWDEAHYQARLTELARCQPLLNRFATTAQQYGADFVDSLVPVDRFTLERQAPRGGDVSFCAPTRSSHLWHDFNGCRLNHGSIHCSPLCTCRVKVKHWTCFQCSKCSMFTMTCRVCGTPQLPQDAHQPMCGLCRPLAISTSRAPALAPDDPVRKRLAYSLAVAREVLEASSPSFPAGAPMLAIQDVPPARTGPAKPPSGSSVSLGDLPEADLLAVPIPGAPITPPEAHAGSNASHSLFDDPIETDTPRPKAKRQRQCPFPAKLALGLPAPPPLAVHRRPKPAGSSGKWLSRVVKVPPVSMPPPAAPQPQS